MSNAFAEGYILYRRQTDRATVAQAEELVSQSLQTASPAEQVKLGTTPGTFLLSGTAIAPSAQFAVAVRSLPHEGISHFDLRTAREQSLQLGRTDFATLVNNPIAWKLILLVFIQVVFVTMVYGPIAAYLVDAFPARIRYTMAIFAHPPPV